MDFYDLREKQLLDTGIDVVKTTSKKVIHKAGELLKYLNY